MFTKMGLVARPERETISIRSENNNTSLRRNLFMLSKTMLDALNDQINAEYYSSYLYLSMAAWSESANLKGFANWFRVQSPGGDGPRDEVLPVRAGPGWGGEACGDRRPGRRNGPRRWRHSRPRWPTSSSSPAGSTSLAGLAIKENDHATHTLLEWFVNEQVEEEATADAGRAAVEAGRRRPGGVVHAGPRIGRPGHGPGSGRDVTSDEGLGTRG